MLGFSERSRFRCRWKDWQRLLILLFSFSLVFPPQLLYAQNNVSFFNLPLPGSLITQSPDFVPSLIKGIEFHPENPFQLDFIIDTGAAAVEGEQLKDESMRLIKYFMASLTVPEDQMWVNLAPHEKDRIIPESFQQTAMGMDLLAEDYLLKQLTASLIYPEKDLGKDFWQRVYDRAEKEYGVTDMPFDSFHRVWIVAKDAEVVQVGNRAFVVNSSLQALMEQDYLAMRQAAHSSSPELQSPRAPEKDFTGEQGNGGTWALTELQTQVMRDVVLPEIEREVNQGEHFSRLRQIYDAMILATWFKITLKESILGKVYVDQNKVNGVDIQDSEKLKQDVYARYLEAFEKGVYNYIKEDMDAVTGEVIPRKYFSGGASPNRTADGALLSQEVSKHLTTAGSFSGLSPATLTKTQRALQPNDKDSRIVEVGVSLRNPDRAMLTDAGISRLADPRLIERLQAVFSYNGWTFHDVTLEAILPELRGSAQLALGKGGLGFLAGETFGGSNNSIGFMPM